MLACFMIVSLLPAQVFAAGNAKCPNTHSVDNCEYTEITTVAPLCEVWGYTVCQCNACGDYFVDVNAAPLGDHVLEAVPAKAPTCAGEKGEAGVKAHQKCTVCGWLFVTENGKLVRVAAEDLVIPALQHTWYFDDAAGCDATVRTCLVCGYSEAVAGEHNWAKIPVILVDPDEVNFKDGLARYDCEDCGASKEVVIRHHECVDHIVTVPKTEPTCTEPGWKMEHEWCPVCDRRYVNILGKLELKPESFFVWKPLGHTPGTAPVPQKSEVAVNLHYTYYAPGSPYFWVAPYDCTFTGVAFADEKSEGIILVYNAKNELVEAGDPLKAGDMLFFQVSEDGERKIVVSYEVDPELLEIGTCLDPKRERTYVCARCEEVITEELQGGHKWNTKNPVLDQKPTCTEPGFKVVACELCGTMKVEELAPIGHNYVAGKPVAGTCKEKAYTPYTCTNCGDTYKVEGDFGKHNEIVISINEPDCVTAGNKLCYCTLCRAYYNVPLEALGHPNSYTKVETSCGYYAVDPTKTVLGIVTTTTFYCYDCAADQGANYKPVVTVSFKEADYDYIYESVKAAQVDHCESTTYTYSDKFDTKTYGAKQKDTKAVHELVKTRNLIPATCLEKGLDEYLCTGCGMYIMIEVAALGHHYEEGEHTVQPTCTTDGYTLGGYCSRCGYVPYEILPATGHNIDTKKNTYEEVEPTCTEAGSYKGGFCKNCENWIRFYTVEVEKDGQKVKVELSEVVANEQALIRPALRHAETVVDAYYEAYYTEMDPGFLYVHYECRREGCDEEYIYWFHRHEWVLDAKGSKAPDDCTKVKNPAEGFNRYTCSCGMVKIETIPVHTYGAESCENYGKTCENCAHVCNVQHYFYLEATEEASCVSGAYNLFVCVHCEYSFAESLSGPNPDAHKWGDPVAIEGSDMAYYGCTLCGEIKIDHLYPEHVIFDLELVYDGKFNYVGQQIAVNVIMSGNTADVWGFDLDFEFEDEYLEFVGYEFGANFTGYGNDNYVPAAFDKDGNVVDYYSYVSIAGNADGSTVVTGEVVATLYFNVINHGASYVYLTRGLVTDPDMNVVEAYRGVTNGFADFYAYQIMDYHRDGVVNLLDVQAVYNYIAGAKNFEYSILGDVDQDGDIDLLDLEAIYKFIVS